MDSDPGGFEGIEPTTGSLHQKQVRLRDSRRRARRQFLVVLVAAFAVAVLLVIVAAPFLDSSPLATLPKELNAERDVSYGSHEHQMLDIVYHNDDQIRPVIVMIHEGGWTEGDKSSYHRLMVEYARLGYVTASINFRPSSVARFPAAVEDCKEAVRWLRTNANRYHLDPQRVGVTGWSSGAHLAMMLAVTDDDKFASATHPDESSRVQAAVCFAGVYDLFPEDPGQIAHREDDPSVRALLGGTPREKPELARSSSPIRYLSPDDPPLLVFHGALDQRIDAEQARQLAAELEALERTDEVVIIPGGDHGRDVLPTDPHYRKQIRDFFAQHLKLIE